MAAGVARREVSRMFYYDYCDKWATGISLGLMFVCGEGLRRLLRLKSLPQRFQLVASNFPAEGAERLWVKRAGGLMWLARDERDPKPEVVARSLVNLMASLEVVDGFTELLWLRLTPM